MITFHPLFAMIPGMLIFLAIYGFAGRTFQTMFSEGEPFSEYAHNVSVVDAEMAFGVGSCEHESTTVALVGKIQNDSLVSWKDINLEAAFFDAEGNLVDAVQRNQHSFVAAAKDSSFFKISFAREFPEEKYTTFSVRVVWAKDARKMF